MGTAETDVRKSEGCGYLVCAVTEEETHKEPGTTIVLHLKNKYFLDEKVLRELVMKYREFIHFLTRMMGLNEIYEKAVGDDGRLKNAKEQAKEFLEEGTDKTEDELVEEILPTIELEKTSVTRNDTDWVAVNSNKPIWMGSDVTDEEYDEFSKAFAKDDKAPLAHIHFTTEGGSVFRALLFIQAEGPNPFQPKDIERNRQLLWMYVWRVFVSGDFDDTIPDYLNFLRGVIDSDELPLNVGSELAQENRHIDRIKRKIVRKVLQTIQGMSDEDPALYERFTKEYSIQMKIGAITDVANRARISKMLRYYSKQSHWNITSLKEYVERTKEDQKEIYYNCVENLADLKKSSLVKTMKENGCDALYITDQVDEAAAGTVDGFNEKKLVDLGKDGVKVLKTLGGCSPTVIY